MKPEEVIREVDNLVAAIGRDDEDNATGHAITLLAGVAVNIARIAEALTKEPTA